MRLTLRNRGHQPAHFAIYRYEGITAQPVHVDVERAHTEELAVAAGGYDVAVQGPNRFWYELAGDPAGAAAGVEVASDDASSVRRLHLELANHGNREVKLSVRGLAYSDRTDVLTVKRRQRRRISWTTDRGWYDIEITAPADPAFRRRLTGHLEDGRPGLTA